MTDHYLLLPAARRAAIILSIVSALAGSAGPIAIGASGIIALTLLPPNAVALATLPASAFIVGSALASIPAAFLMRRVGRRAGFIVGLLFAVAGSVAGALSIIATTFSGFVASLFIVGASSAFVQQYRFAAADAAEPSFKPRAISWVLASGVISGIIGPQIVINSGVVVPSSIPPAAGAFLILAALNLVGAVIMLRLDVPPPPPAVAGGGRPLREIVFEPRFLVALLSAVASYSMMTFVMTATPLAMVGHSHTIADSQVAITWHVIAMFLPSFVTGALVTRFGKGRIAATGFLLIAAAAAVGLTGTGFAQFVFGLVLLGVGWNFGFIAATAMLTELYRPEEAFKVQALNEFVLFGIVAVASFGSGGLLATAGWTVINVIVLPIIGVCLGMIGWRGIVERRAGRA